MQKVVSIEWDDTKRSEPDIRQLIKNAYGADCGVTANELQAEHDNFGNTYYYSHTKVSKPLKEPQYCKCEKPPFSDLGKDLPLYHCGVCERLIKPTEPIGCPSCSVWHNMDKENIYNETDGKPIEPECCECSPSPRDYKTCGMCQKPLYKPHKKIEPIRNDEFIALINRTDKVDIICKLWYKQCEIMDYFNKKGD